MHTHRVAALAPGTLAGGRPYAPGEHVTPDLERDAPLISSGVLVPLADAAAAPARKDGDVNAPGKRRRRAAAPEPEPTAPGAPPAPEETPSQEDA